MRAHSFRGTRDPHLPIFAPPYRSERGFRHPIQRKGGDRFQRFVPHPGNIGRRKPEKIRKRKGESHSQIHLSLTYQTDHGEEGIEHLRKTITYRKSKSKKGDNFLQERQPHGENHLFPWRRNSTSDSKESKTYQLSNSPSPLDFSLKIQHLADSKS
jgi:hypothetical protein